MGLAESTSAVDDHARAQAILALIMEQSADAQGQFAREGDTLAGQQQRLAAQFEDLKASIGEGAIPVMKTLADVTSTVVGTLSEANAATGGFLGQAATIATVGALAAGGLSLVVGQALKMHQSFSTARTVVSDFAGGGGLGRLAGTVSRGGALIGGLLLLDQVLDQVISSNPAAADIEKLDTTLRRFGRTAEVSGELADLAGDDFGKLKDAFDTLNSSSPSDTLDRTNDRLNSVLSTVSLGAADASTAVEEAQQTFDDFDAALAGIAERDPGMAFDILADAAGSAGLSVEDLKAELPAYSGVVDEAKESAAEAGVEVDEFGRSMDGSAGSTANATSAIEEYSDKLKSLLDPLFGAISAANGLRDANQDVIDKTAALVEAEAQYGAGSAEAAAAALALSDAQTGAAEAALDQEGALLTLKDAVDNETVSVSAAKAKLAEWVAQGWITQASADATAAAFDGAAWSMGAIPDGKTIVIGIDGAAPVIGQLDAIARRVNALAGGSFRVSVGGGGGLTMHTGGIVPGPRGQEVAAVLQAGEGVISIPEMDKLTGGGSGGSLSQDVRMSAGAIVRQIVSLDGTVRYVGNVINRSIAHASNLATGRGPNAENWADPISEFGKQAYLRMYGGGPLAAGSSATSGGGKVDVGLHITGTGGLARVIHEEVRDGRIQLTVNGSRVRAA
jgi:hypothetical protein